MNDIISRRLDGSVYPYFCSIIEANGERLTPELSTLIQEGSFFAIAPKSVPKQRLNKFGLGGLITASAPAKVGGFLLSEVPHLAPYLADQYLAAAHSASGVSVLIREPYLRIGDVSPIVSELVGIGKILYKKLEIFTLDRNVLSEQIRKFTVSWSHFSVLSDKNEISTFGDLMSSALLCAVNAYDGESYIYWKRDNISL